MPLPPMLTPVSINRVLTEQSSSFHQGCTANPHPQLVFKLLYVPTNGLLPEYFYQFMNIMVLAGDGTVHPDCFDTALSAPTEQPFSQQSPFHGLSWAICFTPSPVNALVEHMTSPSSLDSFLPFTAAMLVPDLNSYLASMMFSIFRPLPII